MNEYWRSENSTSFCFCHDGEWYQIQRSDSDEAVWVFCPVTMQGGLPVEMHENMYNEVDLSALLAAASWTESGLVSELQAQLNPAD